jgi:hypothetical protein
MAQQLLTPNPENASLLDLDKLRVHPIQVGVGFAVDHEESGRFVQEQRSPIKEQRLSWSGPKNEFFRTDYITFCGKLTKQI